MAYPPAQKPTPDPNVNPFDDTIKQLFGGAPTRMKVAGDVSEQDTPDDAAKILDLSNATGLPPDLVRQNLAGIKKHVDKLATPYQDILNQTPHVGNLMQQPTETAAAKDDLEQLGALEWLTNAIPRAWQRGSASLELSQLRFKDLMGDTPLTAEEHRRIADLKKQMGEGGALGATGHWWRSPITGATEQLPLFLGSYKEGFHYGLAGQTLGLLGAVGGAIVGGVAGGPVGIVPGAVTGATFLTEAGGAAGFAYGNAKFAFETAAGQSYESLLNMHDELNRPLDPKIARVAAIGAGFVNGALMSGAFKLLLQGLPGADKLVGAAGQQTIEAALKVPSVRSALLGLAGQYGKTLTLETLNMVAQRAVQILAEEASKVADTAKGGLPPPPEGDQSFFRDDGTQKGEGFFGNLRLPNGVASEYSIADSEKLKDQAGKYLDYPSLVPTLTVDEVKAVMAAAADPTGKTTIPGSVYQKAEAFALERQQQGKPLFAQPGEANTTVYPQLERLAAGRTRIPLRSPIEIATDLVQSGLSAAQSFALLTLPGPTGHFFREVARAHDARQVETWLLAVGKGVEQSKTAKRAPAVVEQLLAQATQDGPHETLYAPIDDWTTYWQGKGVDPAAMATKLTGDPQAYQQALDGKTELAIPTAKYAVTLAGTEHNAHFAQMLRLDPSLMNAAEAAKFKVDLAREFRKPTTVPATPEDEAGAAIRADQTERLVRQGLTRANAETSATVMQRWITTFARIRGVDPRELYRRYGFTIGGPNETAQEAIARRAADEARGERPATTARAGEAGAAAGEPAATAPGGAGGTEEPVAGAGRPTGPGGADLSTATDEELAALNGMDSPPETRAAAAAEIDRRAGGREVVTPEWVQWNARLEARGRELADTHPDWSTADLNRDAREVAGPEPTKYGWEAFPAEPGPAARGPEDLQAVMRAATEADLNKLLVHPDERLSNLAADEINRRATIGAPDASETGTGAAAGERPGDGGVQREAPGAARVPDAGGEGARAEPRRLPAPDPTERFVRPTPESVAARLTPEITRELERMLQEAEDQPYEGRRWHFLDPEESGARGLRGNAAGGQAIIQKGHGQADVYGDILTYSPLNPVTSGERKGELARGGKWGADAPGAKVVNAIRDLLAGQGVKNNIGEGALRVAERRAINDYSVIARPMYAPHWGTDATPDFVAKVQQLIDAVDNPTQTFEQGGVGMGRRLVDQSQGATGLDAAPAERKDGALVISARRPTETQNTPHQQEVLTSTLALFKALPEKLAQAAALFRKYDLLTKEEARTKDPAVLIDRAVTAMKRNLRALWDAYPAEWRERAQHWYVGANRIAHELAATHGVSVDQAAGVLAALSPQMDWFKNVSLAERVLRSVKEFQQTNPTFTPELFADYERRAQATTEDRITNRRRAGAPFTRAEEKAFRAKKAAIVEELRAQVVGKSWNDLDLDGKAVLLRVVDERTPRDYSVISPEGDRPDLARTANGVAAEVGWGTYNFIANAISIALDGSPENISARLGNEHKVRSFFNNVSHPFDPRFVTIDTHAVGAAFLHPFSGDAEPARNAMGQKLPGPDGGSVPQHAPSGLSGTNGIIAQAYFDLAQELGVDPRVLQSVTWEAQRSLFEPGQKRGSSGAQLGAKVDALFRQYERGKISHAEFVTALRDAAGGFAPPAWLEHPVSEQGALASASVLPRRPELSAGPGAGGVDSEGAAGARPPERDGVLLGPVGQAQSGDVTTFEQGPRDQGGLFDQPPTDTLDTGEQQPRLPGVEGVRDENVPTPAVAEAPFSLTAEVAQRKGTQDTLFQPPALTADDVAALETRLKAQHGLAALDLHLDKNGDIKLDLIAVPKGEANQGMGTRAMDDLVAFADDHQRRIVLSLAKRGFQPLEGGEQTTSRARLVDFYKQFGFVENAGRNKDYAASLYTSMYRDPSQTMLFQGEEPRGSLSIGPNRELHIRLLAGKDLSTYLHENAHGFVEVMGDLVDELKKTDPAALTPEQQKFVGDYHELLKFMGVTDRSQIGTEQHEQVARAFEAYLREGKAPSVELRGVFHTIKGWMLDIYKSLKELNVTLTPEVRGVFDRLLASEDAIKQAQEQADVRPMFTTAAEAGMTAAEFAKYTDIVAQASAAAQDELDKQTLGELQRKRTEWWRAEADVTRQEVLEAFNDHPVYRALALIKNGDRPDGTPITEGEEGVPIKLAKADLADYPPEVLAALRKHDAYRNEGGVAPEVLAELTGFSSADELVQAIAQSPRFEVAVEAEVASRMQQKHGDMLLDGTLPAKAEAAVFGEGRQRVVEAELKALTSELVRGTIPPREAIRAHAEQRIRETRIRDLKPGLFLAAAQRASAKAFELLSQGKDRVGAVQAKQQELVNLTLYREATRALDEVQVAADYLRGFDRKTTRARIGKAGGEYLDRIDSIRQRFDFTKQTLRRIDSMTSLDRWAQAQAAAHMIPLDLPDEVLNESRRTSYKNLTLEELRGVRDAVKQIAHFARLKDRLLENERKRNLAEVSLETTASIIEHAKKTMPQGPGGLHAPGTAQTRRFATFLASHIKLATFLREMDGFKDGGPLWEHVMRKLNIAGDNEAVANEKATIAVGKIFDAYKGEETTLHKPLYIHAIDGSLSKAERLVVALNWGNEGNRQRIRDGYHWTNDQVEAILHTLDARDVKVVNELWAHLESYWPDIAAKQRRVTGIVPAKVVATPFQTLAGDFTGGYFPLKYEGQLSARAAAHVDATFAEGIKQASYTNASTDRGHTKARLEHVELPVRLDLGVITQHLNQVIHDLTHHEALMDVSRLLGHRDVQNAIYAHYGDITYGQIKGALRDIGFGSQPAPGWYQTINSIRANMVTATLGLNVVTSLMHSAQIGRGMARVGVAPVLKGLSSWLSSAKNAEGSVAWIEENSDMMRLRWKTQQRELNEVRNQVGLNQGKVSAEIHDALAKIGVDPHVMPVIADSYYYMIRKIVQFAEIPTFLGAYEKAMKETGADHETSIQLANQAVIDSMGSGMVKDLSQVQRGGMGRVFTTFYDYHNAVYNQVYELVKASENPGRKVVDASLLLLAPIALGSLIHTLTGPTKKKKRGESDWALWAKELGGEGLDYGLNFFVGARELSGALTGRSYAGPAGLRMFNTGRQFIYRVGDLTQEEFENGGAKAEKKVGAALKAANELGGELFGYPARQIDRTVEGINAVMSGKSKNYSDIVFGPRK